LNDLGLLFPLIVRLDQRGNLLLEASDLLGEKIDRLLKAFSNEFAAGFFLAVHFSGSQLDQLPAASDEVLEFELFFRDFGLDAQLDGLPESCQDGRVDAIGLGEVTAGFGEVPCLPGVDDCDVISRVDQFGHERAFITAGGFDDDQAESRRRKLLPQLSPALGIVAVRE